VKIHFKKKTMNIECDFESSVMCAWYAPIVPIFIGNGLSNCYVRYYVGEYTRSINKVDFYSLLNEIKRRK